MEPANEPKRLSTDAEGWQVAVWNLARTRQHFYVEHVAAKHLLFFEDLVSAYGYVLVNEGNTVQFVPVVK